jgi:lipooligosaccharide transport system ATP-binding protein
MEGLSVKDTKVTRVTSDRPAAHQDSTEQVGPAPASAATPAPLAPSAEAPAMITARGLRKSYGAKGNSTVEAVKGIDVEVRKGEAFGFLGPNGAGKSSTMRMIAAVSPATGGTLQILGMDPAVDGSAIRARIGVCPQEDTLDNELTVVDNLIVYGRYFGLSRAEAAERTSELLSFVQLTEKSKAKVEDLSGGMKRRLTIARSLINNPDLLLLDEPTTGLDPQARHQLWDRLFRLKQQGVTLVLTTHYMDEAEQLCDRLVVMDKGVIVAEGSPADLIREHSTREVLELRFGVDNESMADKVDDLADRVEVLPDRLLLYTHDGEGASAAVQERGLHPLSSLVRRATLEDVFLRLTGRTLVD